MPPSDDCAYEQLCNDARSINQFVWQAPVIATTATGGLWYATATFDLSPLGRTGLMLFSALIDIAAIIILFRLRYIVQRIREDMDAIAPRRSTGPNYVAVAALSTVLIYSAAGSILAAIAPAAVFIRRPAETRAQTVYIDTDRIAQAPRCSQGTSAGNASK